MGRVMGLDVGDRTVGIALSDPLGVTAQGLPTLERTALQRDLDHLEAVCREHEVERIVVGLPLNMDGSEGPRAALTRAFARELERRTGLPLELWDERLSTAQAERILLAADVSRRKRREVIDRLAAQVILQSWMEAHASVGDELEEES